jgi:hypothetical protein
VRSPHAGAFFVWLSVKLAALKPLTVLTKETIMANWKQAFLAMTIAFAAGFARAEDPETPAAAPQAPPGHFLVHEELWTDLADEPGRNMDQAREAFLAVDLGEAAAALRKAATYLKISASQAADGSKRALLRSAHELDSLAHRVEAGTVKSVAELDSASARALHSLSHYHCVLGERSWAAEQTQAAGRQMRAAADNLERAAVRTGKAVQHATHEVAKDVRIVSGKLIEGTGFAFDEVGKGFAALGRQVEYVGKKIEPAPATAATPIETPIK